MKEDEVISLASEGLFNGKRLRGKIEETHISWIVLCKAVVFKIKKPIKLSFLDFSTLSKRKVQCEREIHLNRRFTDIYERAVVIRLVGSRFIIGGKKGRIVDYAVLLKRLATERRMDNYLKKNKVGVESIVALAKAVSDVHHKCRIVKKPFALGYARDLFNDVNKEARLITKLAGSSYGRILRESVQWSDQFLAHHQERFRDRVKHGFTRDVHGDLHSGNIFIYRKPVIFDCIEFNDAFRKIDVLYEIAFLCMDLEKHRKTGLARIFVSEYNKAFLCVESPEDIRILNYFKCLRANIRAKVHAIGVRQSENEKDRGMHLTEIKRYLLLMRRYLISDKSLKR